MVQLGRLFRSTSAGKPQTAQSFSAPAMRRSTTTATAPIQQQVTGMPVRVTGYSTLTGVARQGVTPTVSGLQAKNNNVVSIRNVRMYPKGPRGLFR